MVQHAVPAKVISMAEAVPAATTMKSIRKTDKTVLSTLNVKKTTHTETNVTDHRNRWAILHWLGKV